MALLVAGDLLHPGAEAGHGAGLGEEVLDEMLPGLGHRRLDDHVVERDRLGELGEGAVGLQLLHHPLETAEDVLVSPAELGLREVEAVGDAALDPDDLLEEAVEEDRVRASSTCWVARKYFCSSFGAASM